MGWEGCILDEGHRFTQKEHYPGYQQTVFGVPVVYFISWQQKDGYFTLFFS